MRLSTEVMAQALEDEPGRRDVFIDRASSTAFEGQQRRVAYAASKSGVAGKSLPVARDLSLFVIRLISNAPHVFETPMLTSLDERGKPALTAAIPFYNRLARPDELARLVTMVIGHESSTERQSEWMELYSCRSESTFARSIRSSIVTVASDGARTIEYSDHTVQDGPAVIPV